MTKHAPLVPNEQVTVTVLVAGDGTETPFYQIAHELSHSLGTIDLYGSGNENQLLTQLERLSQSTKVFASPFRTLARLQDKGAFAWLVTQLGLPVPETVVMTSDDELREATDRLERYFARGVACIRHGRRCTQAVNHPKGVS